MHWNFQEAASYYRKQGAPSNQQALVEFLREAQEEHGGVLPANLLAEIAAEFQIKESFLSAVIRRYPSLRTAEIPHLLEVCGGERCHNRGSRALRDYIEQTYAVQSGGVSQKGKFAYRVTGCMKHCMEGPNLKWDGQIYSGCKKELIQTLVEQDKS